MNFIILDIALLILFLAFAGYFLYKNRKNLQQDGWLLLYRTKWGMKLIEKTGKKYQKTLKVLSYVSIIVGIILMISVLILMIQTVYLYFTTTIAETIKAPPLMPLIPYFPQIFHVQSIFPPFYFIYFIIAVLIVATCHEFSHGIFASRYGIRIKSTGFAFLKYFPVFFGAFVEQDDKQMNKKGKFEQMTVLSAGVFANVVMVLIFAILFILFFKFAFVASGVSFDAYSYSAVSLESITSINGVAVMGGSFGLILDKMNNTGFNEIIADDKDYIITKEMFSKEEENQGKIILFDDAPAIRANLSGVISAVNGVKIDSREKLSEELGKYEPGDKITITTLIDKKDKLDQEIVLGENPESEKAWLGIGFFERSTKGIKGKIFWLLSSFKEQGVYYKPVNEASQFIYDLLWWILLINFAVALFNMLPLGFLDGGRFLYLGVLSITKSEKFAEGAFKAATYFLLFLLLLLMIKWVFVFFF